MKYPLKDKVPSIPPIGHVGDFAYRRSFYYHPGIDLYCSEGQEVCAMEDGILTHVEQFTGSNAEPTSPWWNDTWSIMIEGASGVIGYCELMPSPRIQNWVPDKNKDLIVFEGEIIGHIIPVLKKDKGNGTTMLHLEHYLYGTREHVTWVLDTAQPKELLNPRALLESINEKT